MYIVYDTIRTAALRGGASRFQMPGDVYRDTYTLKTNMFTATNRQKRRKKVSSGVDRTNLIIYTVYTTAAAPENDDRTCLVP